MPEYPDEPTIGRFKLRVVLAMLSHLRRRLDTTKLDQPKMYDDLILALIAELPNLLLKRVDR